MSFQQGVSGLNAASKNLEVIGNNVANSSTVGAKTARAEFADVYARASGTDGINIGLGVSVATVAQQFQQGSISTTDNPLDVAINGNGFFQLQDPNGINQYSRNGQFEIDRSGFVVNAQGMKLLGHPITNQGGMLAGKAQPLQVPTAGIEPSATTAVKLEINLDSRAASTATGATPPIDFSIDKTYNNATSLTTYDAKGQSVALTYFFQKSASDTCGDFIPATKAAMRSATGSPMLRARSSAMRSSITVFMLAGTTGSAKRRGPNSTEGSHSLRLSTRHLRGSRRMLS